VNLGVELPDDSVSAAKTCSSGVPIKDVFDGVVNEKFNTIR